MAAAPMTAARDVLPELAGAQGKPGTGHTLADGLDVTELARRVAAKGMALGSPVMIRVFKSESELEVWMHKGERFELLAVYPICNWSGVLGPKLTEGDKQSPEGFYSIGARQLHRTGRWPRSLDIGFPNTFDRAHGRTGSYILVHGGCTSTGCYAMTDPVMEEIYALGEAALRQGQWHIPVHVFPFRMTQANLAAHTGSEWSVFWASLKEAYDLFERTRRPPYVSVCNKQYVVSEHAAADSSDCMENVSHVRVEHNGPSNAGYHRHARRLASRAHARRGRNARRAYAAARAARMAAAAKQHHATVGAKGGQGW
jgi:murein L,D-transpeptidase YafK